MGGYDSRFELPSRRAADPVERGWRNADSLRGMSQLVRPARGRMIGGVCAGIANRYGWDVGAVRALFVLSMLLPGPQVLIYIVLWALMPEE